jgi:hypothetical protein
MTPEMMKWALGAMASLSAAVLGAVVWLTVLVFRVGQKYGAVENTLEAIQKTSDALHEDRTKLDRIPIIELKVDQLAQAQADERRRFASEWPEMREKVATLWQKVFSMANWRKSQGQYGE